VEIGQTFRANIVGITFQTPRETRIYWAFRSAVAFYPTGFQVYYAIDNSYFP